MPFICLIVYIVMLTTNTSSHILCSIDKTSQNSFFNTRITFTKLTASYNKIFVYNILLILSIISVIRSMV